MNKKIYLFCDSITSLQEDIRKIGINWSEKFFRIKEVNQFSIGFLQKPLMFTHVNYFYDSFNVVCLPVI